MTKRIFYVLPDIQTRKSSGRFSQLCDRIESDSYWTVRTAYSTIADLFSANKMFEDGPDAYLCPDIEKKVQLRDHLSTIETDVASIEAHIPSFLSKLPKFGKPDDETKIKKAQTYCAHTKKIITDFRGLPFYDKLFASR